MRNFGLDLSEESRTYRNNKSVTGNLVEEQNQLEASVGIIKMDCRTFLEIYRSLPLQSNQGLGQQNCKDQSLTTGHQDAW